MKQVIFSKEAPAAVGPYSHAIDCGNLVFLSGQVPLVPETGLIAEGGIEGQARQMFANIKAVLQSCGMKYIIYAAERIQNGIVIPHIAYVEFDLFRVLRIQLLIGVPHIILLLLIP